MLDDLRADGGALRAAFDIAATKFAAGCTEGGQVARDTPRPAEGAERPAPQEGGSVEAWSGLDQKFCLAARQTGAYSMTP